MYDVWEIIVGVFDRVSCGVLSDPRAGYNQPLSSGAGGRPPAPPPVSKHVSPAGHRPLATDASAASVTR